MDFNCLKSFIHSFITGLTQLHPSEPSHPQAFASFTQRPLVTARRPFRAGSSRVASHVRHVRSGDSESQQGGSEHIKERFFVEGKYYPILPCNTTIML